MITARFDDLRPRRRRSFELAQPDTVLIADRLSEVAGVVAAAEQAVAGGSWVAGYLAYEAAPAFDPALRVVDHLTSALADLPLAYFAVFSRRRPSSESRVGDYRVGVWSTPVTELQYRTAVDRIRDHIRRGETYQVNLTFPLHAEFGGDPDGLYRDLSHAQTCGYGSYLDTGRWVIASASPELFFEWRHGRVVCRPMKGTARRGVDIATDEDQRQTLVCSEKNRAENLMIVDMVRNDLGRVARVGSVSVPDLFSVEKYDTVWQLTSTVTAEPITGTTLVDLFSALFPSASITGAPKVATMEIISRLEPDRRGVYCGAIGFGGPGPGGPEWAFNVAIRTVLIDRDRGVAHYGTGGGITYDSTAVDEYAEATLKTQVLARRSADFALLETMRWEPATGFRLLDRHLRRLSAAAWYFDIPLDPAEVRAALDTAVGGKSGPHRIRVVVDRVGWVKVEGVPLGPVSRSPVRLEIDDQPIDRLDPFLRHKTTNRAMFEAASARHPEADDVVLVNGAGEVTETTIANLAVRLDGVWYTPPVSAGCLPGIERERALEAGELIEASITIADLLAAPEVARLNSVRGWQRVVVATVAAVETASAPGTPAAVTALEGQDPGGVEPLFDLGPLGPV